MRLVRVASSMQVVCRAVRKSGVAVAEVPSSKLLQGKIRVATVKMAEHSAFCVVDAVVLDALRGLGLLHGHVTPKLGCSQAPFSKFQFVPGCICTFPEQPSKA